ncbi:MAG: hypothetical protein WAS21_33395 [Geminicoccaceae bacterium]
MRILFLGSNPTTASTLPLAEFFQEIEESIALVHGGAVDIQRFPKLPLEELPGRLSDYEPDILHITAHGETEYLEMSRAIGDPVKLSGTQLSKLLPAKPPRIVYLSACNAVEVARSLAKTVPIAIGCSTTIKGVNARHTTIVFLQRILAGRTVAEAFSTCKAFLEAAQGGKAKIHLFKRPDVDPNTLRLFQPLEITARFEGPTSDGGETIRFGVVGCPDGVRQVVFFTDGGFQDSVEDRATRLCQVTRGTPSGGRLWAEEPWGATGSNFQVFCSCVQRRRVYSASATLKEALTRHYEENDQDQMTRNIRKARIGRFQ